MSPSWVLEICLKQVNTQKLKTHHSYYNTRLILFSIKMRLRIVKDRELGLWKINSKGTFNTKKGGMEGLSKKIKLQII